MTNSSARDRIYDLLRQSSSDSQFDTDVIDAAVNQGRRIYGQLITDQLLPNLRVRKVDGISVSSGIASFPTGFVKMQKNGIVKIDSVQAVEIKDEWRLKFLNSNDNAKADTVDKYYRVVAGGLEVYPTDATSVTQLDYVKVPGDLSTSDNTDLPKWVEDLTIDWAFERLMTTDDGDIELAVKLLKERGVNANVNV